MTRSTVPQEVSPLIYADSITADQDAAGAGQEGQRYNSLRPLRFEGTTLIRTVAMREDDMLNPELLRVEIEIVEEK